MRVEKKIDKDCVAVIPVHNAGHPVPMDKLMEIAKVNNLKVIEDCAHSAGGVYKNKRLGTWGDIGCFSFEEKKCFWSCFISLEIYSAITRSKLLDFKNYLSVGPIYFAAGLIKISCFLCSK